MYTVKLKPSDIYVRVGLWNTNDNSSFYEQPAIQVGSGRNYPWSWLRGRAGRARLGRWLGFEAEQTRLAALPLAQGLIMMKSKPCRHRAELQRALWAMYRSVM